MSKDIINAFYVFGAFATIILSLALTTVVVTFLIGD